MRRQAVALSLNELRKLEKAIKYELTELKLSGIKISKAKERNVQVQINIINYPTMVGKRKLYCNDTWEFECLTKKGDKK